MVGPMPEYAARFGVSTEESDRKGGVRPVGRPFTQDAA